MRIWAKSMSTEAIAQQMFFYYDRSVFLVFRTSLFCSYSSTRAAFLPILQHHDKVTSRRMLNTFDTLEFRTAEGVLYDYLACK